MGVPLERCEEIMGSIYVGRPGEKILRRKLDGLTLWKKDWRLKNKEWRRGLTKPTKGFSLKEAMGLRHGQ